MKIEAKKILVDKIACDLLVLGVFEDKKPQLGNFLKKENFEAKKGETLVAHTQGKILAQRICFIGLGKSTDSNIDIIRDSAAHGARKAIKLKAKNIAIKIDPQNIPVSDVAQAIAEGFILGSYKFMGYHKKTEKHFAFSSVAVLFSENNQLKPAQLGVNIGKILSDSENHARDLVNSPSNKVTPSYFASYAKKLAIDVGLECKILDPKKEGMECLWAVACGSKNSPKVVVIKYKGSTRKEKIALIGKGITFDSGGISIKPSSKMWEMKMDMAGAAAVLEAMRAIALLKLKQSVVAVIPLAENMPDGGASRPGDIVGSLDGTTVEIISTDAEGRMILADAITYAKKLGATKIFDCATLTGGCVTALGDVASGLLGNDDNLIGEIKEASKKSGQKVWHLPLFEEYKEYLKSNVADIKNCMDRGMASASTGAVFLREFVGDLPWVHLDIAGTAYLSKIRGCYSEGATGTPLRTILEWLRSL